MKHNKLQKTIAKEDTAIKYTYQITSYSGFFYVTSPSTGKLLIEKSFRTFEDAKNAAKHLK